MAKLNPSRRFLAPEVVQTSAMDCGPATLKCLLAGFGVAVGYDRLREACQTDVDGTSIDTMEEVASELGLEAEQIMIPPDHLLVPEAAALPAILVVANPLGITHFVVVWRRHGPLLQVMDPAVGRVWMGCSELFDKLYHHRQAVPAAGWREWAGSDEFRSVLEARTAALGFDGRTRKELAEQALADPGWRTAAAVDAAVRMAAALVRSRALPRGRPAAALVESVLEETLGTSASASAAGADGAAGEAIPEAYWSVRPVARREPAAGAGEPPAPPPAEELELRGAVLVRAKGRRRPPPAAGAEASAAGEPQRLSEDLAAALGERAVRPAREIWRTLKSEGLLTPVAIAGALAVAAAAMVIQLVFFRGLLDLGVKLVLPEQRLGAAAALALFLAAMLALEVPVVATVLRLGRHLEVRLRLRFLERIARLPDRYFKSRLASDMAERSHNTHMLHEVPEIGASLLRIFFHLVLTTAAIIWLDPGVAPVALTALALALALPLLSQPVLAETDLRVRNHAGALSRFYLDALLGLVPARNHGAERAMRREHEGLLLEWHKAALRSERAKLWFEGVQVTVGYGLAIWLVFRHLAASEGVGNVLLLAYWALNLQYIGEQLTMVARQVPIYRNVTRRLLEPLGLEAGEEEEEGRQEVDAPEPSAGDRVAEDGVARRGVWVLFHRVRVVAGGHRILDGVDLEIEPGSHVAVVGPSGAGKSTLLGLLLGWHQPAAGTVHVDGELLSGSRIAGGRVAEARMDALRRETAWVDPAIQLWNRPLLDNLRYGSRGAADHLVGGAIDAADLRGVLEKLPQGLQTPLGEGGALVSGGEGQRVRFARALLRPAARLVLLDEPFRGLDRTQRRELTRRARDRWRRATLFYVSHDLAETLEFDRVVVVENGRISESGAPGLLAAAPESRYAALLRAEEALRRDFEDGASWRRLRLAEGRLVERPAASAGAGEGGPDGG